MNRKQIEIPITSFTLSDLLALSGKSSGFALLRASQAASSASDMEPFRFPCRIDAFLIGVGAEGEATVSFNLNEYRLHKGSLFVFGPNNIIQMRSNEDFRCHVVVIASEFFQRINLDAKHMLPLFLKIAAHPFLELAPDEAADLQHFIALLERETNGVQSPLTENVIGELALALIYKIGELLNRNLETHPESEKTGHSRAEEYFRQFMMLLGEHYKQERSVGFYARQLCITSKYLTTLIRQVSGKSVSEWIDSYVILEAKTLLKYSNMSIQEIAYYLNFANQSFFGSYFKRNTGMSPSQYKAM